MLTKEKILGAKELPRVKLAVPEWGGEVFVRALTGAQRDEWDAAWERYRTKHNGDAKDYSGFHAHLVAFTACDENGGLLFTEDDVHSLNSLAAGALARVAGVAMKLNGMGAVEVELAKNSEGGPSGSPG